MQFNDKQLRHCPQLQSNAEVAHNIDLQARHTQRPELAAGKDLPPKRDAAVAACTILVRGSTWVRTENIHLILFFET